MAGIGPLASDRLDGGTGAQAPAPVDRVRALAAEFEALLLSQMLREMRGSLGEDDESGFGDGPLSDTVFSELSLALSRAGGLGFAGAVLPRMEEAAGAGQSRDQVSSLEDSRHTHIKGSL